MINKFKKKMKSNKGDLNGGLMILVCFMALMIIGFSIDIAKVQWQKFNFLNQITFVSRIVARQGGAQNSKPNWFESGLEYVTSSEIRNYVDKAMSACKVEDYRITVNGTQIGNAIYHVDFQEDIITQGTMTLTYSFLPQMIGFPESIKIEDSVLAASEFFYRTNTEVH